MPHAKEKEPFLACSLRMCVRKTSNYAKNTTIDFWLRHKHLCFISRFTRIHHELWPVTVQVVIAADSSMSSVFLQPLTFPAHKTQALFGQFSQAFISCGVGGNSSPEGGNPGKRWADHAASTQPASLGSDWTLSPALYTFTRLYPVMRLQTFDGCRYVA